MLEVFSSPAVVRCFPSDCPSVIGSVKVKFSDGFWSFLPFIQACYPYPFLFIGIQWHTCLLWKRRKNLFKAILFLKEWCHNIVHDIFTRREKITHDSTTVAQFFKLLLFIFQSSFTGAHFNIVAILLFIQFFF